MSIADLPHAVLQEVAVNEIAFDQKHNADGTPTLDDPIKLRLGAFIPLGRNKFYIGCISLDVLRLKDGKVHRTEVGFLKFAIDEFVDGDRDPVPLVELFLTRTSDDSTDAAEDRVLTASRKGVRLHVPLFANDVPAPQATASRASDMWSPDGLWVTQQQVDGNFVTYELARPFDKGRFKAVWDRNGGPVKNPQWEGPP